MKLFSSLLPALFSLAFLAFGITPARAAGDGPTTAAFLPTVPVITVPDDMEVEQGRHFRYLIQATNDPRSFQAQGLPDGLELDPVSGLIQGTPTKVGVYQVVLRALNAGGTSAAAQFRLTVQIPLVVVSILTVPNTLAVGAGQVATYVFNRSGGNTQSDFVLSYTLKGTAVPGVDYRPVSGKVHFLAGEYVKTVKIVPRGNAGGPGQKRSIKFGAFSGSGPYRVSASGSSVIKLKG